MTPATRQLHRLALLCTGPAATRLIATARALPNTTTIALYAASDERALFVRDADERVCLPELDHDVPAGLQREGLGDVLRRVHADAVWPGWGRAATDPDLVDLCTAADVAFVGPSADFLRKIEDSGLLQRLCAELGLAYAGPQLTAAEYASRRYLGVSVLGDRHGNVWGLGSCFDSWYAGERALMYEAPTSLDPEQALRLCASAVQLARRLGLHGGASLRFLQREEARAAELVDIVPSLGAQHAIGEVTTGLDLIKLQLHVAAGGRLEGEPPRAHGYATGAALFADRAPDRGDGPRTRIERLSLPMLPFVRVDAGYVQYDVLAASRDDVLAASGDDVLAASGDDVLAASGDDVLATLVAAGGTRGEARQRLRCALVDTASVLSSGSVDKGPILELLREPVRAAAALDGRQLDARALAESGADIALLHAAVEAYEAELAIEKHEFARSAARGRPRVAASVGCCVELHCAGHSYALQVERLGAERYHVAVDEHAIELAVLQLGPNESRVRVAGRTRRVLSQSFGNTLQIEVDGARHIIQRTSGYRVRAPAPAVIVSVEVKQGDRVAQGDCVAVLEAMKNFVRIHAPRSGTVGQVWARPNVQVAAGRALLVLITEPATSQQPFAPRLQWSALSVAADDRSELDELQRLVLGYDVDAAVVQGALIRATTSLSTERWQREDAVIEVFVDLLRLFRRQPTHTPSLEGEREDHVSTAEYFYTYLRDLSGHGGGLPSSFLDKLRAALRHYGVSGLERTPELHEALFRICKAQQRLAPQAAPLLALLQRRIDVALMGPAQAPVSARLLLDRLIVHTHSKLPALNDAAREVRYLYFERPLLDESRRQVIERAREHLSELGQVLSERERRYHLNALIESTHPLLGFLSAQLPTASSLLRKQMITVLLARQYQIPADAVRVQAGEGGVAIGSGSYEEDGRAVRVLATQVALAQLGEALHACAQQASQTADPELQIDVYCSCGESAESARVESQLLCDLAQTPDVIAHALAEHLHAQSFAPNVRAAMVAITSQARTQHFSFRREDTGRFVEQSHLRGVHPMLARRLELWRLARFALARLPSVEEVFLFRAVAHDNAQDERLIALAEVRDLSPLHDSAGHVVGLPHLERVLLEALAAMRFELTCRPPRQRPYWNRVQLFLRQPLLLSTLELNEIMRRLAPATTGLGLEHVWVAGPMPAASGELRERVLDLFNVGSGPTMLVHEPSDEPLQPLSAYAQKLVRLHRQSLTHPFEIIALLAPSEGESSADFPRGEFTEYELSPEDELVPVQRAPGDNTANLVVGVLRSFTPRYPEGMARVVMLSDPSQEMGSLAEPECRRVIAALALARALDVPVEWFTLSAGAKIAMDSGTENMDWIALVLRRIIEFTQAGGELNIVVHGINVGGQPYWNAEATMLMHTRGILIMTADSAMVLTGKRALDFSGGISADDNFGIGGYERIMGPNGQAQYLAEDLTEACRILLRHYEHSYVAPGERLPRRAQTSDPIERSVLDAPHAPGYGFVRVGDVFCANKNPERKRPFDIRSVLRAAIDQDHAPLERWLDQRGGEVAVVWDAHLGGWPVCLLGIESQPVPRMGLTAADGPDQYTPGTLFPVASKKIARAVNAASGSRPLVVLANLTGFDGSPESMRHLQLEYGAEIGRAVVNFRGPIVFCVISRYHGGAFVVFSAKLHDNIEVAALEGSFASVIGGAPAAAVVFAREVERRTRQDAGLKRLEAEIVRAEARQRALLKVRYAELFDVVYAQMLGQVAHEFDSVHTVERAQAVGSVHHIIAPARLRPYLVEALERGITRAELRA